VPAGVWEMPESAGERNHLLGFVIVQGLVCREAGLRDRHVFELLGPGDVVQPPVAAERPRLGGPITFTAAVDTEVLALGESFVRGATRWPGVLAAVHRRLEAQRDYLAIQGLIVHLPRAEHRLLLQLWHLTDRWGRVTTDGTLLPLPLTHELLGHLVGARRSTVTLALTELESQGYVRRVVGRGWLLTPAVDDRVAAIAGSRANGRLLGETFRSRYRSAEVMDEARALHAEAEQNRSQSRAAGGH
jgi:CRP/FNR family transcriptional regulator, cyclic AMP receptor protein